ncbi:hypothetical protein [Streptomyces chartreusis]|uniref:hypothetical protein n=1 Tax=Streptomyces chartreusis TaxID=1969 RepID=UPI002E19775C
MDGMTIAGVRPIAELVDLYVIYEDGTPAHLQVPEGAEPALSRPGRFVSAEEYGQRLDELNVASTAYVARLHEQDEERTRTDYLELRRTGVRHESASRMSGYTGPAVEPAEEGQS